MKSNKWQHSFIPPRSFFSLSLSFSSEDHLTGWRRLRNKCADWWQTKRAPQVDDAATSLVVEAAATKLQIDFSYLPASRLSCGRRR